MNSKARRTPRQCVEVSSKCHIHVASMTTGHLELKPCPPRQEPRCPLSPYKNPYQTIQERRTLRYNHEGGSYGEAPSVRRRLPFTPSISFSSMLRKLI